VCAAGPDLTGVPGPGRRSLGKLTIVAIEHSVGSQARSEDKPGSPRHLIFGIVAVGLFMSSIDTTIVATALPAIHTSLQTTINWAGWTLTVYSLGMVIVLPIAGKISDELGRRRVFFCAVALFTIASLLCGVATSIYLLIAFRAIQAIGGGALQPSAAGIVAEHFGQDRDKAIGLFGTIASGGQVIGPVVGGILVGYLSWRWIFFVNVPIGIVLLGALVKFVPDSPRTGRSRTDIRGLVLMGLFILAANFGITSIGNKDTAVYDPVFLVPEAFAVVMLCLFIRHTRRSAAPFIPMRLFRAKGFAVMNSLNLLWGVVGFGLASLAPLYAEDRYHLTPLSAGTLLAARGVGAIVVGAAAAMALRRTGYRMPLAVGFTVVAIGTAAMAISPQLGLSPQRVARHRRWHYRSRQRHGQPRLEERVPADRAERGGGDHRPAADVRLHGHHLLRLDGHRHPQPQRRPRPRPGPHPLGRRRGPAGGHGAARLPRAGAQGQLVTILRVPPSTRCGGGALTSRCRPARPGTLR
jgi:EmrB/QacA subfamily drug resistance transporter